MSKPKKTSDTITGDAAPNDTMPHNTMPNSTVKEPGNKINGFIGVGVTITGKLSFSGVLRIDGKFTGDIASDGILIVGPDAFIESTIKVGSAYISGEVHGTIETVAKVELIAPCRMHGDIKTPKLVIHDGAFFEGNCGMQALIESSLKQLPMDKRK